MTISELELLRTELEASCRRVQGARDALAESLRVLESKETSDTYSTKYIETQKEKSNVFEREAVLREADAFLPKAEAVLKRANNYDVSSFIRSARFLREGTDGEEWAARAQKLTELTLLDDAGFEQEVEDAFATKNLPLLHLARLAVRKREYSGDKARGQAQAEFSARLSALDLPEAKRAAELLNQINEFTQDLKSAREGALGGRDIRGEMHRAMKNYRELKGA